jgi:hypothetical protein
MMMKFEVPWFGTTEATSGMFRQTIEAKFCGSSTDNGSDLLGGFTVHKHGTIV